MARKKRILIVDDEEGLVYFLREHLAAARSGFEVEVARSAQEAVFKIEERLPDLVITDLQMPGVDGLQLLTWIRTAHPDTRMILMTAYGSDEVQAEARRLDVYRYLTKPFRVQELVTVAEEALGDMAFTGGGIVVLSDESFGAITVALEGLRVDVGARCVLLSDSVGRLVTRAGAVKGIETNLLLALLSGIFLATLEVGHQLDESQPTGFSYLECRDLDVCAVMVNQELFLVLLLEKGVEASRVGTVWFYARQVANSLDQMLEATKGQLLQGAELEVGAGFGESLAEELESMLGELQPESAPAGDDQVPQVSLMPDDRSGEERSLPSLSLPDPTSSTGVPRLLDLEAAIKWGLMSPETAESLRSGEEAR